MSHDPLNDLYAGQSQGESWIKRYGKRIAGGMACSAAVAMMMNLGIVKSVLLWVCQIILLVGGRPHGAEKLDTLEHKVAIAVEKGKEFAKEHHDHPTEGVFHKALAPVKGVGEAKTAIVEVAHKAEAIKDTAAQGVKAVNAVGKVGEKVVEAVQGAGNTAMATAGGIGASITGYAHARAEAQEKAHREALEAHAAVIGFKTDKEWSLPRLQEEGASADRKWPAVHGPNGQCPNPKCHYALRIHSRNLNERIRCPRCGAIFSRRQAVALGPPVAPHRTRLFGR